MIQVGYITVLFFGMVLYTIFVHLINWWVRTSDNNHYGLFNAYTLILTHIIGFALIFYLVVYPLI